MSQGNSCRQNCIHIHTSFHLIFQVSWVLLKLYLIIAVLFNKCSFRSYKFLTDSFLIPSMSEGSSQNIWQFTYDNKITEINFASHTLLEAPMGNQINEI